MLKNEYTNQADIPEGQRGAYVQKGDKWVLDDLENTHPLVVNSRTLKTEKQHAETARANAERERDDAKDALSKVNVLQPGQRAVPKADAELVEVVKAEGVTTPDVFRALKTEHGTYKTKAETSDRRARFDDIRKKLGWNEDAVDVLELIPDLPEIEDRDAQVNGETKKVPHAKLKSGDEVTFRPLGEYFAEKHKALLRSVTDAGQESGGTELPGHGAGGGGGERSFAADIIKNKYAPKEKAA